MAKHASVITNGIDGDKPPPGFASVASATGTPQVECGGRQERGNSARVRETASLGGIDEDEMVGRADSQVGGNRGASRGAQLIGVNSQLQTCAAPGLENRCRLPWRERPFLAEDIAPSCEAFACDGRKHLVHDVSHV
jgi:hypothetical protein